jgi:hypothetical protein
MRSTADMIPTKATAPLATLFRIFGSRGGSLLAKNAELNAMMYGGK